MLQTRKLKIGGKWGQKNELVAGGGHFSKFSKIIFESLINSKNTSSYAKAG